MQARERERLAPYISVRKPQPHNPCLYALVGEIKLID